MAGRRPGVLSAISPGENHCPTAEEVIRGPAPSVVPRWSVPAKRGLGRRAPCAQAASPPLRQALGLLLGEGEVGEGVVAPQRLAFALPQGVIGFHVHASDTAQFLRQRGDA